MLRHITLIKMSEVLISTPKTKNNQKKKREFKLANLPMKESILLDYLS